MKKALLWGTVVLSLFVLMGCPKEPSEPPEPYTLTVTGIPQSIAIVGGSLLLKTDLNNSFATGVRGSGNDIFTFYHPDASGRLPDTKKPFHTSGSYVVALAEVDMTTFQEKDVYFYINDATEVSFPASASLPWSSFKKK